MAEIDEATEPDGLGGTMIRVKPVWGPESSSKLGWEDTKEAEPRTIWVWDRDKQAWVETTEKPTAEEFSTVNGSTTRGPVVPRQPSATPASVIRKVRWPGSAWKVLATRASVIRVTDALAVKSKAPASGAEAGLRERTEKEAARIISEARQQAKELPRVMIRAIEERAQKALGKSNDKSREMKAKSERKVLVAKQEAQKRSPHRIAVVEPQGQGIIKAVEEKAKARAENIVASAEEKARTQAEKIIAQMEEKADKAENIVASAEEKAMAQAERIIALVGEKAEAKAENIIARAEEKAVAQAERIIALVEQKAREQAETIAAEVKAACEETVAATERQAQHILKVAEEKAKEIKVPAETTAKAVPEQLAPRRQGGNQKERPVPNDGTAELVIGPPVDLGKMEKLLNRLTKSDQIRVLALEGSKGKGIRVKLFSRNIARLPNILVALPEIEKVSDLPRKVAKICPSQWICPSLGRGNEPPARRLLVTMEKRTTYIEI